jgi:hypothetical protein
MPSCKIFLPHFGGNGCHQWLNHFFHEGIQQCRLFLSQAVGLGMTARDETS